ncbi:condensin-2 complex subunit D3-like [Salvia splendens]|uniref:condensin-2 complex subunit D3-like n=1 Tax=Salvia splendens TaxID=180675 RepID=UPI001C272357|nr:condensin-2 complex subunit D3-like [Salvia splendens]
MDEVIARIVADLESHSPISHSFLRDLDTLLDFTLKTNDTIDIDNFYNELSSRNLSLTSLTNAISTAMDSGISSSTSVLASKVYLSLLLSPNSPVFTLFTPMAFLSLLRVIRLAVKKPSSARSEGSASRSSGGKKRGKRKNGGNQARVEIRDFAENGGEERGYDVKDLFLLMEKLEMVMGLVHLDRFPDCLKALVQTMCEIPMTAVDSWDSGSFRRLSEQCSRILSEALKGEHGDLGDTAAEVLKALRPLILLSKSQVRSFGLGFVVNRMVEMGEHSDEIKKAVANMPKFLLQRAPEKAEPRASAVESVMEIVKALDCGHQVEFADYVVKMSRGKTQFRVLAVDIIPVLLVSLKGASEFDVVEDSWCLKLSEALIQRCSDSTAVVRARALTNLAQVVVSLSGNDESRAMLKEVIPHGGEGMSKILKLRSVDEKAAVRKAALLLISKSLSLLGDELDEELLKTVGIACSDPLVSIRKVAISALSEAFRKYSTCLVTKEWMHSVTRLIGDNETSIQEECESFFSELVLDRISRACDRKGKNASVNVEAESSYTEGVLGLLKELCDGEVLPWVKKICSSLGKKKKLQRKTAISLQNIIRASEDQWVHNSMPMGKWTAPQGAWFLLSEVSAFVPKAVDWEFLHHHWQLLDSNKPANELQSPIRSGFMDEEMVDIESHSITWMGDRVFLLQTISNVSMDLPPEPAADLAQNFLKRLEGFNMHPTEVDAHIKALKTLCRRKALNQEEADTLVMRWVDQLKHKASQVLESYMSQISNPNKESSFLTPPPTSVRRKGTKKAESKSLAQAIVAIYTIGSLVIVCPSASLKDLVPTIHTIITSGSSDPKSSKLPTPAISVKKLAPSLYVHAWLAMGKICLADGKLAKRYIPLFVQELEKSDSATVRNNIVVMMADFCVRYTAMVDCYMSKITKCLRDPCELVRRQTFILLGRLLQRDYVKWRGLLFLRFLLCLVDDSDKIRQLADFLFGNILKAKAPLLAYNSFVESVFVLNDCNAHTGRSNSNSSRNENHIFTIRGNDERSRSQRMHIYATLLKQMAPEHLLATFAKVCAEILAAASDGMLSLEDTTGQSVIQDAFLVLASKEIRIQASHGASSEAAEMEEEGGDGGGASTSALKGRAITQAVRKGLIQNAIPIFIELKRLLESKNSPLIGHLMDCLRILLKDYKNEIDDILVADRQLQKELIYDMQRYESMKAKSTAADAVATVRRSEAYQSPKGVAMERNPNMIRSKLPRNLQSNSKVASAVADAAAAATARSVLREVNAGASTPLGSINVPKLKSRLGVASHGGEKPAEVIESLRRRQCFDSDDEK